MVNKYHHNKQRQNPKAKSSLVTITTSNHKLLSKEVLSEYDENSRRNSVNSLESLCSKSIDEPLSNYIQPDKGPEFYSQRRSRSVMANENFGMDQNNENSLTTYKTNSDVYPALSKNALMNQSHDHYLELKELTIFEKDYQK